MVLDLLLAPLILFSDLFLLLWRKVILYVKCFPNFLGGFPFDHVSDSFTGYIEKSFDVQIVSGQYQFKESSLINLKELLIPRFYIISSFLSIFFVFRRRRVVFMMCRPFYYLIWRWVESCDCHVTEYLFHDWSVDIW